MKTFTIRGLDEKLDARLKKIAKSESISVNQWILKMLRQTLGLEKQPVHSQKNHDLDNLFGTWSEDEYQEFERTQDYFNRIDKELWK